jgi:rod shape-determining protein MreD
MKYAGWFLAAFAALLLQGRLSVLGVVPNLAVLPAFYAGIRYGQYRGLFAGMIIGAFEDSLSSSIIGPNMLAKGLVGYVAAFFDSGGLFRWTQLLGIISVFALTLADSFIVEFSRLFAGILPGSYSVLLFVAFMQSLLNAPAGLFMRPQNVE